MKENQQRLIQAWVSKAENDLLNVQNNLQAQKVPWDTVDIIVKKKRHERWRQYGLRLLPPTCGKGGHRLFFRTVGQGSLGPSATPGLKQGAVTWKIDHGEGQLAGASGLITSNFCVSATGEVTDHHCGVLWVPQSRQAAAPGMARTLSRAGPVAAWVR